jgi:hypothetical protein
MSIEQAVSSAICLIKDSILSTVAVIWKIKLLPMKWKALKLFVFTTKLSHEYSAPSQQNFRGT